MTLEGKRCIGSNPIIHTRRISESSIHTHLASEVPMEVVLVCRRRRKTLLHAVETLSMCSMGSCVPRQDHMD
jgi:hypothetical protein